MSRLKEDIDLHTKLAGSNRFEMLLFKLNGKQRYGINVFKIKEVIHCIDLTLIPNRHPAICGIATIRDLTVPVIDLSLAIGYSANTNVNNSFIVVTEYNNSIQGFLVSMVEKIVNLQWDQISPPPTGVNGTNGSYLTSVVNIENEIIEILDVERVLQEISPTAIDVNVELKQRAEMISKNKTIIIIDDSNIARNQISKLLQELKFNVITFKNGKEALDSLNKWVITEKNMFENIALIVCDIEMPEMDGYTFTTTMKQTPELKNLFIILHTSLTGAFNQALVDRVGADKFVSKFEPNVLAKVVLDNIK